ncbi:MAG: phosphoribosylformylglycinamidine cyclo-ligase [Sphingobacteriales bacterium]|nr:phosphoribosylformylglycinamidine cyclo-ligase [Sphingobacteriales bacterium]
MKQYKEAGVDIEAGYEVVQRIKKHTQRTAVKGVTGAIGGFGALFDLSAYHLKEPVLVSGTDGVGTKLKIAFELDKHDTIGIDCVAMCANDIIVQGAKPLFFLDYLAVGKNNPDVIEQIVKGVADGCQMAGCALIGGETAEMPSMYANNEYDIAGFCVGAAEKSQLINGSQVRAGDAVLGIAASGIHSNGFSLVRKIISACGLSLHKNYSELHPTQTLGEVLLTPTSVYVPAVLELLQQLPVLAMSHITGGGFYENVPRMFADTTTFGVAFDKNAWQIPPVFLWLAQHGKLTMPDCFQVFNMGIGLVLVVREQNTEKALRCLNEFFPAYRIGTVIPQNQLTF